MAQSTVFDFVMSATLVAAVDVKNLRAVQLNGPGGQGEGHVGLYGDGFVFARSDIPSFAEAQALYALWRDRLDTFGGV